MARCAQATFLLADELRACPWFEFVNSEANWSDGASHLLCGDPFAQRDPAHPGDGIIGHALMGGPMWLTMQAQNFWVLKKFQETQRDFLWQTTEIQAIPEGQTLSASLHEHSSCEGCHQDSSACAMSLSV